MRWIVCRFNLGGILEVNKEIGVVRKSILKLINEESSMKLPKRIVEKTLAVQYSSDSIEEAITKLLDEFVIDLVIDYPAPNSELDFGHPIWFLKILSKEEIDELRGLSHVDLNLLQILRATPDDKCPGELPVDQVKAELKSRGFSDDEIKWLSIKDRVEEVRTTWGNVKQRCLMIIPEYEKTEEYKKFQEESEIRATEKELWTMQLEDEEK